MKALNRLKWMVADRDTYRRDARVNEFLERRGWPEDPMPQPQGRSIEDREDVAQELRLAHWQGTSLRLTWHDWCDNADFLARFVGYAEGGVWNAN